MFKSFFSFIGASSSSFKSFSSFINFLTVIYLGFLGSKICLNLFVFLYLADFSNLKSIIFIFLNLAVPVCLNFDIYMLSNLNSFNSLSFFYFESTFFSEGRINSLDVIISLYSVVLLGFITVFALFTASFDTNLEILKRLKKRSLYFARGLE